MSGFSEIKKLLSDRTDKIAGTVFYDDGVIFRVSTKHGTMTVARSDRYKVGDRVYVQKGNIVGKLNQTQTKVFEV